MAMPNEELEGFICPMCLCDYHSADYLLAHFKEEHSEEQDLIKTFKDLLDKAKKKILKQESLAEASNARKIAGSSYEVYEAQRMGAKRSYTKEFIEIRESRIQRISLPTNQIVIRLEKLLDNMPSDPIKKKVHEQSIVPWIDGEAVSRCPECAGAFRLARRQHHCRTCGSIMCNDCSNFLPLTTAKKMIDKPLTEEDMATHAELSLRLCIHCISLLKRRERVREAKRAKPIICQFYDKLSELKKEADSYISSYKKICLSLNAGESAYNLAEAQTLRGKLLKLGESIDILSSRVAILGKESENPPQGQALRLQTSIRAASTAYIRNNLLTLPKLPTEEEFLTIQNERRMMNQAIEEERLRLANLPANDSPSAKAQMVKKHKRNNSSPSESVVRRVVGEGWIPEKKKGYECDDPLIEQMNIIRSYIKDAKAAHKTDEVESLEANLKELKAEYWRKQQNQDESARSGESSEAASLCSYEGV